MSKTGDWILRRLSRVTSSGRFVPEIDGLRFAAIVSVVLYHAHGHFLPARPDFASPVWASASTLLLLGWFGVPLFFVISGFILALPFAESRLRGGAPVRLKTYYLRRLTRLEPPYVISAVILAAMLVVGNGWTLEEIWRHFVAGVLYVHEFAFHRANPINHVTWTLEIEVQFYVLAPLLATVFAIRRAGLRRAVLGTAILAAVAQKLYAYDEFVFRTLLGQIQFFLVGFVLADVYLVEWRSAPGKTQGWDVVGAAAWLGIPLILLLGGACEFLLPAALLAAYMAAFRGPLCNRFFRHPWIVVIGGMCYTTYLYHVMLVWHVKVRTVGEVTPAYAAVNVLQFAIVTVGILAVSAVLFVLFEKPFMRKDWPARVRAFFAPPRRAAAVPAAAATVDSPPDGA